MIDYYAILQVQPDADADVIAKAYRTLIARHHPDVGGDGEQARLLNEAYEVLSDPQKRAAYDRALFAHHYRTSGGPRQQEYSRPHEWVRPASDVVKDEVIRTSAEAIGKGVKSLALVAVAGVILITVSIATQLAGLEVLHNPEVGFVIVLVGGYFVYRKVRGYHVNRWLDAYCGRHWNDVNQRRAVMRFLAPYNRLLGQRHPHHVLPAEFEAFMREFEEVYGPEQADLMRAHITTIRGESAAA